MLLLKILFLSILKYSDSFPTDEFHSFATGELTTNDEVSYRLKGIVPSGYGTHKLEAEPTPTKLPDLAEYKQFRALMECIDKGYAKKGLTFSIFDENMRETVVKLYELLEVMSYKKDSAITDFFEWGKENINDDMLQYTLRVAGIFLPMFYKRQAPPHFLMKPNYFVNGETIVKAMHLKINDNTFDNDYAKINQFFRRGNVLYLNSNYSGWNRHDGCENHLSYFMEDVGLNSYYFGIHLLHPFWMSYDKLDQLNPRHVEHYYFAHQQLYARYMLEQKHLIQQNANFNELECHKTYNPYLMYSNGLPFPTRMPMKSDDWNEGRRYITSVNLALKECLSRGMIVMRNGSAINLTEENHTDLITKILRANLDGMQSSSMVRSYFGYGGVGQKSGEYNPSPSVLHHPETSLRDPLYWHLTKALLDYYVEFRQTLNPLDLSQYETDSIIITESNVPDVTTYFTNYEFDIGQAFLNKNDVFGNHQSSVTFAARQRRLAHKAFNVDFTMESKLNQNAIVRLFLGPECIYDCWDEYTEFFLLDSFLLYLTEGQNKLSWSPKKSERFSTDYVEKGNVFGAYYPYDMFKFPETLVVPHGAQDGLNLTLFIMIIPQEDNPKHGIEFDNLYQNTVTEIDDKPLGFPFHRPAVGFNPNANNYKLYNIKVNHKGEFSSKVTLMQLTPR